MDYNGYDYEKFWTDSDRDYEDMADRMAIRKLLPTTMESFVDIGGGYGRLANEYLARSKKVTIFDYSKTELKQAKEKYGDRIETKAGDIYDLPFKDESFDGMLMVRVSHHLIQFPAAVKEFYRVLKPGGTFVIEIANKKTLPKKVKYIFRKSKVNPYDKQPSKLDDLEMYNYHPKYVEQIFKDAGFKIDKVLSVSNFRSAKLKKMFGTKRLVKMENKAQGLFAPVRFAPSIYYRLTK
jgi:ubiquinone/menaquinone biosynthesis C-methylase UbiE